MCGGGCFVLFFNTTILIVQIPLLVLRVRQAKLLAVASADLLHISEDCPTPWALGSFEEKLLIFTLLLKWNREEQCEFGIHSVVGSV